MKPVKLNDKQRTTAQGKLLTIQIAQQDLNTYVQGLMEGLGLEGRWNLNTSDWTFTEMPPKTAEVTKPKEE